MLWPQGLPQIYALSLSLGVPKRAASGEHRGFVITQRPDLAKKEN